jgi:hypothetical protein
VSVDDITEQNLGPGIDDNDAHRELFARPA